MSIIDRLFVGRVIKDFGTLEERLIGIGKMKKSALLVERHGRPYFVIKASAWALLGASVTYQSFALENAFKIREYINESEQIAHNLPPITYNGANVAIRNSVITALVVAVLNLLVQSASVVALATFVATVFQVNQYNELRSQQSMDSQAKTLLIVTLVFTLFVGIAKFAWLTLAR